MSKHTPGPWHAVSIGTQAFIAQERDELASFALANIFFPNYHPDGLAAARAEQAANTRLIAAAPDLLALAQRYAEECVECNGTGSRWIQPHDPQYSTRRGEYPCEACADIRAVIDKAEGRT